MSDDNNTILKRNSFRVKDESAHFQSDIFFSNFSDVFRGKTVVKERITSPLADSERTLEGLIPRLESPVILSVTNAGYLNLTENMISSATRLKLKYDFILVCEDDIAFDYFRNDTNVYAIRTHFTRNITGPQIHSSELFEQLVSRKIFYVRDLIQRGLDVFFVDSDVVFLQDPTPYLRKDFDIIVNDEAGIPHCPGLFFIRSTEESKKMISAWITYLHDGKGNQVAFNKAIFLTQQLSVTRFSQFLFVRGDHYFSTKFNWKEEYPFTVLVHVNHVLTPEEKMVKLKESKLWFTTV